MNRRPPNTSVELLDAVADAFESIPPAGVQEAEEELRAAGLDPGDVAKRLAGAAREALTKLAVEWRATAAAERQVALKRFQAFARPHGTRAEMEKQLQALLSRREASSQVRAAFHKLEGKATDKDLASLIAQLEYLDRSDEEDGT